MIRMAHHGFRPATGNQVPEGEMAISRPVPAQQKQETRAA